MDDLISKLAVQLISLNNAQVRSPTQAEIEDVLRAVLAQRRLQHHCIEVKGVDDPRCASCGTPYSRWRYTGCEQAIASFDQFLNALMTHPEWFNMEMVEAHYGDHPRWQKFTAMCKGRPKKASGETSWVDIFAKKTGEKS